MIFTQQEIPGVYLIEPELISDSRGIFRRHFCKKEFRKAGLPESICQANISENFTKHTLRGFHYQSEPFGEDKTISVISGSIYNIVVDLRKNSPTYLKWSGFELKAAEKKIIHSPKGGATAFLSLEDNTTILYYMSEFYNPSSCAGIRYNDPLFNFKWPALPKIISEKDASFNNFKP